MPPFAGWRAAPAPATRAAPALLEIACAACSAACADADCKQTNPYLFMIYVLTIAGRFSNCTKTGYTIPLKNANALRQIGNLNSFWVF